MAEALHNKASGVVHRGRLEACNLDQADDVESLDPATAQALLDSGVARLCEHCGDLELPTLNTRGKAP